MRQESRQAWAPVCHESCNLNVPCTSPREKFSLTGVVRELPAQKREETDHGHVGLVRISDGFVNMCMRL